jgi:hypothetical protein
VKVDQISETKISDRIELRPRSRTFNTKGLKGEGG